MTDLEIARMERDNWAGIVDRIAIKVGASPNRLMERIDALLAIEQGEVRAGSLSHPAAPSPGEPGGANTE